ncbi:hypothetical protein [Streptomyces sp. NBC_00347]|uniref:hypothetical protein n=1 Tax=Streptomyces sp. NBC_00347 TaxID=2975721 RepID=UPI0022579F4D|nr:hypothetical protein [Streptomyces sp. NBC_00347]MCX5125977.1 hypothetical protein [Streptomyces sp. NBC_00347]
MSNYWTGRRVPSAAALRSIYDAVALSTGSALDRLERLEHLRKSAARRGMRPDPPREISDIRAADRISELSSAPPALSGSSGTVPARGPAHDRHSSQNGKVKETVHALLAAQAAGNRRGVIGIAWSASKALTHGELSVAAADLYASAHSTLGEALLLGGRERAHEDTMRLAVTLIRSGLTAQADLVLSAALPRGGDAAGQP